MTSGADRPERAERDYTKLPPAVDLDDTVAGVETEPAPDPEGGRNPDQHRALRDD